MANSRMKLSDKLHAICKNVYFQPPTGYKLEYPCIVYSLDKIQVRHADNAAYTLNDKYSLQYITRDPDNDVKDILATMPLCSPERFFTSENLYHYNFTIYI